MGCVAPVVDRFPSISLDHLEVLRPLIADLCHGPKTSCLPFDLLSTEMVKCEVGGKVAVRTSRRVSSVLETRPDFWVAKRLR